MKRKRNGRYTKLEVTTRNRNRIKSLKAASSYSSPDFGKWAYDRWVEYNSDYFDRWIIAGEINWGLTPHGGSIGSYHPSRNLITLHTILITPGIWSYNVSQVTAPQLQDARMAEDCILHEMIHQYIHQMRWDEWAQENGNRKVRGDSSHNNEVWISEILRISELWGLDLRAEPVLPRRMKIGGKSKVVRRAKKGYMTRDEISRWPHSIRPEGYYNRQWT